MTIAASNNTSRMVVGLNNFIGLNTSIFIRVNRRHDPNIHGIRRILYHAVRAGRVHLTFEGW
jgi:hypothetical protein